MTGLDCNILVQLALADHPANAATWAAVQAETQRGSLLVFPSLVATEFLHVVTDAKRFDPPLTMTEALDGIEAILANATFSATGTDARKSAPSAALDAAIQPGTQTHS